MQNINVKMFDGSFLVLNEEQKRKLQFILSKYFGSMFLPKNATFIRMLNIVFIEYEYKKSKTLKQSDSEFILDLFFTQPN